MDKYVDCFAAALVATSMVIPMSFPSMLRRERAPGRDVFLMILY